MEAFQLMRIRVVVRAKKQKNQDGGRRGSPVVKPVVILLT